MVRIDIPKPRPTYHPRPKTQRYDPAIRAARCKLCGAMLGRTSLLVGPAQVLRPEGFQIVSGFEQPL